MDIGVILSKDAITGIVYFDLCHGIECLSAGQLATFNQGRPLGTSIPTLVDSSTHELIEYKVTDLLESSGWRGLQLTVRITKNTMPDLPEQPLPVVIRWFGRCCQVTHKGPCCNRREGTLPTGGKLADYGNLLEKYDRILP